MQPDAGDVTQLLRKMREAGSDEGARERLFEIIYGDLKRLAALKLRNERAGHTLQATDLVNEAYLRIAGSVDNMACQDRVHLMAIVARQIRHVLVDYARARNADKRFDGKLRVTVTHLKGVAIQEKNCHQIEEALAELERKVPIVAKIVELKIYGGLGDKEIATHLDLSYARVRREWEFGRSFLKSRLGG